MASVAQALEPGIAPPRDDRTVGVARMTGVTHAGDVGARDRAEVAADGAPRLAADGPARLAADGADDEPAAVVQAQVAAARRGDADAFADLFMAHERRLRLLAFGVLRDPDLVDDALQETALRAFRALGSSAARPAWARGCTASRCASAST